MVWARILQASGLSSYPGLLEQIEEMRETYCSPYLLGFLVDFYEDALETNNNKNNQTVTLNKALEVSSKGFINSPQGFQ